MSTTYPDGTKTTYTYGWGTTTSLHHYVLTQGTAKPWVKTWYDNCGREVLTETVGPKDYAVSVSTTYNQKGLPSSRIANEGTRHQTETLGYDGQGRLTSDVFSTGRTCSYSYGKLSATSTEDGVTFQKTFDPWGNLKKSVQGGKSITYTYGSHGKPVSVRSSADSRQVMSVQYDDMVCRTSFTDVDAGTLSYSYDGLNRLVSQTDARGKTISYTYNTIGQKTKETTETDVTTYVYNTTGYGLGKLSSASRGAYTIEYDYDELGRVTAERRCFSTSQSPYSYTYQYNPQGLLDTKTYPGGVVERFQYDAYGNMTTQTVNNQTVWQHVTATGKEDTYALGGGALSRVCGYNDAGRLTATTTQGTNVSNPLFQMSFDYLTPDGNLAKRHLGTTVTEQFSYDTSNRLTSVSGGGENTVVTYSLNGNITNKTGLGQYYYDTDKPHAVSAVDNTDGLIPLNTAVASYNGYGKLSSINNKGQIKYNTYKYGPDGNRWLLTRTAAINVRYVGDMEYLSMPQKKTWFYYLANDILYVKKDGAQDSVYYMCRDNLGSIMKLVGANGHVAFDATYDAWGRQTVNCNQLNFFRGYTGHEMLTDFNLINMNGRMYDPLLGRFLSPDNYVQFPYDSQNFNRYSYCLNNPLKYTDPSGELFGTSLFTEFSDLIGNIFKHGFNVSQYNWAKTDHAFNIDVSMFQGTFLQVMNKWSWNASLSVAGLTLAHSANMLGIVNDVTEMDGMIALDGVTGEGDRAFTFGHFSFGPNGYKATWKDHTFVHEYGHYIQSQQWGPTYFTIIGGTSLQSASKIFKSRGENHLLHWYEADASYKGAQHFDEYYGRGNENYSSENKQDFFDIYYFQSGKGATYVNPRTGRSNSRAFPFGGSFYYNDIPYHIISLMSVPIF